MVVAEINTCGLGSFITTFHHGKLFVEGVTDVSLPLEEQEAHLIVLDLSDYSQKEIAADFFNNQASIPDFYCFYKDKLYGNAVCTEKTLEPNFEDHSLVELDTVTGKLRTLVSKPIGWVYATDSTLYYLEEDTSYLDSVFGYELEKVENPGFRECDLKTGAIKDCGLPVEDAQVAYYDEKYIYLLGFVQDESHDQKRNLYFLSRDYKLLDQIELANDTMLCSIASDRLFFYGPSYDLYLPICFYLDKSEIGSHALSLERIENH